MGLFALTTDIQSRLRDAVERPHRSVAVDVSRGVERDSVIALPDLRGLDDRSLALAARPPVCRRLVLARLQLGPGDGVGDAGDGSPTFVWYLRIAALVRPSKMPVIGSSSVRFAALRARWTRRTSPSAEPNFSTGRAPCASSVIQSRRDQLSEAPKPSWGARR